ncbi:MAG: hypothetical protein HUK26_03555 [Duodenibacillus sp.]|nr:hypothetical protein [Duodenibacillus sp.]
MKRIVLAAALAFVFALPAQAFDPDFARLEDPAIAERYPSGSIRGRKMADEALAAVRAETSRVNKLADAYAAKCVENFFVNRCVDDVRRARMRQLARVRSVESEARRVLRAEQAEADLAKERERTARARARAENAKNSKPAAVKPARQPAPVKPARAKDPEPQREAPANSAAASAAKRQAAAEERRAREAENLAKHQQRLAERDRRAAERDAQVAKRQKKLAEQAEADRVKHEQQRRAAEAAAAREAGR